MATEKSKSREGKDAVETTRLDLSTVVGRPVELVSEQFPGRKLSGKVLDARGATLSLDRSVPLVGELVSNQRAVIRFEYRGQKISASGILKRTAGGRCQVVLDERAYPCSRRRYPRVDLTLPAKLTMLPSGVFDPSRMSRWRWFETDTVNISGGGALLDMSTRLERGRLLLVHIEFRRNLLPPLLLAEVRHCSEAATGCFQAGVKFVVAEEHQNAPADLRWDCVPKAVREMTPAKRRSLDEHLRNLL